MFLFVPPHIHKTGNMVNIKTFSNKLNSEHGEELVPKYLFSVIQL